MKKKLFIENTANEKLVSPKKVSFSQTTVVHSYDDDDIIIKQEAVASINVNLLCRHFSNRQYHIALRFLIDHSDIIDIDRQFYQGRTVSHYAFSMSDGISPYLAVHVIKELLSHGASLETLDESGYNPLNYASIDVANILFRDVLNIYDLSPNIISHISDLLEAISIVWNYANFEEMQSIIKIAQAHNLKIKASPKGEQSFFESITYFVKNIMFDNTSPDTLRNAVIGEIYGDQASLNLTEEYLNQIVQTDFYPDDLMISYLTKILGIKIIIHHQPDHIEIISYYPEETHIFHLFEYENNYMPVISISEESPNARIESPNFLEPAQDSPALSREHNATINSEYTSILPTQSIILGSIGNIEGCDTNH